MYNCYPWLQNSIHNKMHLEVNHFCKDQRITWKSKTENVARPWREVLSPRSCNTCKWRQHQLYAHLMEPLSFIIFSSTYVIVKEENIQIKQSLTQSGHSHIISNLFGGFLKTWHESKLSSIFLRLKILQRNIRGKQICVTY